MAVPEASSLVFSSSSPTNSSLRSKTSTPRPTSSVGQNDLTSTVAASEQSPKSALSRASKSKFSRFKLKKSLGQSAGKPEREHSPPQQIDDEDDDSIPADSDIQFTQHEDPHHITVSSIVDGMTPWEFLGMVLDDRFTAVIRAHKPAMGYRTWMKDGEYKPAPEPWHKEAGYELIVHNNVTESILARMMRTANATSYIKLRKGYGADSDKVHATWKLIIPKFRRVEIHGDVTITRLDSGAKRIGVATDVYLKLGIPLIGGWIESFMKSQIRIGYKILPTLVNDFLALGPAPHPLDKSSN